jgi:hypothetical protein
MPLFNQLFRTNNGTPNPGLLAVRGPIVQVEVQLPSALAAQYQALSRPIPAPITGWAMVDTGASKTCVDDGLILGLGVAPINQITVQTPSGSAQQFLYPARFSFPGTPLPNIDFSSVVGSTLAAQGIVALIGRDVLSRFLLVYNGPAGMFSLSV